MGGNSSKPQTGSGSSSGRKKETILGKPLEDIKKLYNFGKELGSGGFGITYLCTEISTGESYACKSISKRKLRSEEEKKAVKTEIDIMRHVSGHDNIVQVKSVHEDKKFVYIVMELCTGGELFDEVKKLVDSGDSYTEKKAAGTIAQLVKTIEICHSMDVVHRDVKPDNFLFSSGDKNAVLKAIDFGCSAYIKEGSELKKQIISRDYVAPEVLQGEGYGKEIDIWGAGVILYNLLCGKAPFLNETEIKRGDLDLHNSPWLKLSVSARNLIQRMLNTDPKERITAQGVLAHPWIIKEAPDTPLDNVVLSNLKQFQAMNKLKKLALKVMAESLSEEEIKGLKTMFENMDTDKSGSITCEELKTGLTRLGSKHSETEVKQLMEAADVDGNGTIDYIEFISAMMHRHRLVRDENLHKAFQYFDKDGSGHITIEELEKAMEEHGMGDGANAKDIISEVDKDNNGKIDYEEFCTMMSNGYLKP